ncbi:MAG TPA: hypothetical protein VJ596_06935 [Gemmatimonadaceae bacterium]|nr:hypothetical protein [Gemmatimonadaceae bacterium]
MILVPGPLDQASALRTELELPFLVLSDADDRIPLGDDATLVVADRYGHVYFVQQAGLGHELPPPQEVEEWLKFLATQCPE